MPRVLIRLRSAPKRSRWARFWRLQVDLPNFDVRFPDLCPHCMGQAEQFIAIWAKRVVNMRGEKGLRLMVPVCDRVREPVWLSLLTIVTSTLTVMSGLLVAVRVIAGSSVVEIAVPLALGALTWRLLRAKSWVRLRWFDDDHFIIAARRGDYAQALVAANNTDEFEARVVGKLTD